MDEEKLKLIMDRLPFPVFDLLNTLKSNWANEAIDIHAPFSSSQWDDAGIFKFDKGLVLVKNDAGFLYLVLDVIADTVDDSTGSNRDYFWLSFDVDKNKSITSNVDVNYGLYPNQPPKLGRQFYLGPGRWTGILNSPSPSGVKLEFSTSAYSDIPHKIWKFKILLSEIGVSLAPFLYPILHPATPYTYFGFRVRSVTPHFDFDYPKDFFMDFRRLKKLEFSRKPKIPSDQLGPLIGSVGLIPSTKITGGRATTASSYYVHVQNAAFGGTLNLIGNRTKLSALYAAGNRNYIVEIKRPGDTGFSPLVSAWTNYVWNGTDYVLESFSLTDGKYKLPDPALDFSIDDLLIQFSTYGLASGIHSVKVSFFNGAGTTVTESQTLDLFIDNHLPLTVIEKILHGTAEVSTCAIEEITSATDGFTFEITASDPEGNLLDVNFVAEAGNGSSTVVYNESYDLSKGNWTGFSNKIVPSGSVWKPPFQCSYNFRLSAHARTTNGYSYIGYTYSFKGLTVLIKK